MPIHLAEVVEKHKLLQLLEVFEPLSSILYPLMPTKAFNVALSMLPRMHYEG